MLEINKIHQGDCLELMKEIPDKCIDAIICDLPYGTTACSWDVVIPFDKLWEQYKRIRKNNTPIVLFGSEPFSTYLRMSNIKEYKYDWIWEKSISTGNMNCNKMPLKSHEIISIFYKNLPMYNPQMTKGKPYVDNRINLGRQKSDLYGSFISHTNKIENKGTRYPRSVIKFNNGNNKNIHPTQKPVALLEYLIKTYSNEGDLILDNCSGSGSTAIAAYNTKRNFICIEKDKDYYEKSVERLDIARSQLRLF